MRDEETKNSIKNASDILLNPDLWQNQIVLNKQLDMTTPKIPTEVDQTLPTMSRKRKSTKPKSNRVNKIALESFLPNKNTISSMKDKAESKIKNVYNPPVLNFRKKKSKKSVTKREK